MLNASEIAVCNFHDIYWCSLVHSPVTIICCYAFYLAKMPLRKLKSTNDIQSKCRVMQNYSSTFNSIGKSFC